MNKTRIIDRSKTIALSPFLVIFAFVFLLPASLWAQEESPSTSADKFEVIQENWAFGEETELGDRLRVSSENSEVAVVYRRLVDHEIQGASYVIEQSATLEGSDWIPLQPGQDFQEEVLMRRENGYEEVSVAIMEQAQTTPMFLRVRAKVPPVLLFPSAPETVRANETSEIVLRAYSLPGDPISYSLEPPYPENLIINRTSGVIRLLPTHDQVGETYRVKAWAASGRHRRPGWIEIRVIAPITPDAIIFDSPAKDSFETLVENQIDIPVTTVSMIGSVAEVSMKTELANASFDPDTSVFSFDPKPFQAGVHSVTFVARRGGVEAIKTIQITVLPGELSFMPFAAQTLFVGETRRFQVEIEGNHSDVVFIGEGSPENLSLDPVTGKGRFTPDETQVGRQSFRVIANRQGVTTSQVIEFQVSHPGINAPTDLSGSLLSTEDQSGLAGMTVSLEGTGRSDVTDSNGNFVIKRIPVELKEENHLLRIKESSNFGSYQTRVVVKRGIPNSLSGPILLAPKSSRTSGSAIAGQDLVLADRSTGISLEIPAGSATTPQGQPYTESIAMTPVNGRELPFSLPEELAPAMAIRIEPYDLVLSPEALLTLDNVDRLPVAIAGQNESYATVDVWYYDPESETSQVVGKAKVQAGAIITERGQSGIRRGGWYFVLPEFPTIDDLFPGSVDDNANRDRSMEESIEMGSNTSLATGNLSIVHDLATYRSMERARGLRLVYNTHSAHPRPVIAQRVTPPDTFGHIRGLSNSIYLHGNEIGPKVYTDLSTLGIGEDSSIILKNAIDASGLRTGVYPYRFMVHHQLLQSRVSGSLYGDFIVNNQAQSPFGSGWTLANLSRIWTQDDGSVLLVEGDGSSSQWKKEQEEANPNGLEMQMYELTLPTFSDALSNEFAGWSPVEFATITEGPRTKGGNRYLIPTINFMHQIENSFKGLIGLVAPDLKAPSLQPQVTFFHKGINGIEDYSIETPLGDDLFFELDEGINSFGVKIRGWLTLPVGGDVMISMLTDNPTILRINGYSLKLLDPKNPRKWPLRWYASIWRNLPAGAVPIEISYGAFNARSVTENFLVLDASGGGIPGKIPSSSPLGISEKYMKPGEGDPERLLGSEFFTVRDPRSAIKNPRTQNFVSPKGEFSTLSQDAHGEYVRVYKDGTKVLYDSEGLQTSVVDRLGNATSFFYDETGLLERIVDPINLHTELVYQGGRLAEIRDPAGRVTRFQHNSLGHLLKITDPDESTRSFEYDRFGVIQEQVSKRGFTTRYEYNEFGHNTRVIRPTGVIREMVPEAAIGLGDGIVSGTKANPLPAIREDDLFASYRNGRGHTTQYRLNHYGAIVEETDPLERRTQYVYNDLNQLVRTTNPRGISTEYQYDDRGNLEQSTVAANTADQATVSYTYTVDYNLIETITDELGNEARNLYDDRGNKLRHIKADGESLAYSYLENGLVESIRDERGYVYSFTYDRKGNIRSVVDPLGVKSLSSYDRAGNLITASKAVGTELERSLVSAYDRMNRLTRQTDAMGRQTRLQYDEDGNLVTTVEPTGERTSWAYDEDNRQTVTQNPRSGTDQSVYDENDNLIKVTEGKDSSDEESTSYRYDRADQLIEIVYPDGGVESYEHDENGNQIVFKDALGNETARQYDFLDRLIRESNALGLFEVFDYDKRGGITRHIKRDGAEIFYRYDGVGRLTTTESSDEVTTREYDAAGNLVEISDNDSHLEFDYDPRNDVLCLRTQAAGIQPFTEITFEIDALGRVTALADSFGGQQRFIFDDVDNLIEASTPVTGKIGLGYDNNDRLLKISYPNSVETHRAYNPRGLLTSLRHERRNGETNVPFDSLEFEHAAIGHLASIKDDGDLSSYRYDANRRLTEVIGKHTESFDYDVLGNRLSEGERINEVNQLIENEDYRFVYDENGNCLSKTSKAAGTTTEYRWNNQDQLIQVSLPDGNIVHYHYDGLGRRIGKRERNQLTSYIYANDDVLLQLTGDELSARFLHGEGDDQPLACEWNGAPYYYHANHQGSITSLTDRKGAVVNHYEYSSFGELLALTEGIPNAYRFTGREWDLATGLYYYRARYYDPYVGRFISEDPMADSAGDSNLYQYTGNNPVNFTDPSGNVFGLFALRGLGAARGASAFRGFSAARSVSFRGFAFRGGAARGGSTARGSTFRGPSSFRSSSSARVKPRGCFVAGTMVLTNEGLRPIEAIKVGDRVTTRSGCSVTAVDVTTWKVLRLTLSNNEDGGGMTIDALRSPDWIELNDAGQVGARVWMEFAEIGIEGWAQVESIRGPPQLSPGDGRVVLTTFTHQSDDILELDVATGESLRLTSSHRLFSLSRNAWIPAKLLKGAELLCTVEGSVQVRGFKEEDRTQRVYNLEVETEHYYFVGCSRSLSHNKCTETSGANTRFTRTQWQAPGGRGTGYSYTVYQQKIDWNYTYRGRTNLARALNGNSPYILKNGRPSQIHLHHSRQNARGSLFELSKTTHNAGKNAGGKALHPYGRAKRPYPVNRKAFDVDRKQYWIERARAAQGQ